MLDGPASRQFGAERSGDRDRGVHPQPARGELDNDELTSEPKSHRTIGDWANPQPGIEASEQGNKDGETTPRPRGYAQEASTGTQPEAKTDLIPGRNPRVGVTPWLGSKSNVSWARRKPALRRSLAARGAPSARPTVGSDDYVPALAGATDSGGVDSKRGV